jgi:hypothetical protein
MKADPSIGKKNPSFAVFPFTRLYALAAGRVASDPECGLAVASRRV